MFSLCENYAGSGSTSADLDYTVQFRDTSSGLYDFLIREYSQGAVIDCMSAPHSLHRLTRLILNRLTGAGLCLYHGKLFTT